MSNEIAKPEDSITNLPDFMKDADLGYDEKIADQFIRPPRIKVVQAMSSPDLKKIAPESSVILTPTLQVLREGADSAPFTVVPLLFYPEYIAWNPRTLESLPMIAESSLDPTSDLAKKCQDRNTWFEECPDAPADKRSEQKYQIRNCEHLNFIVAIMDEGPLQGVQALVSFSRAAHSAGTNFISLIRMRQAPMYGCRFNLQSVSKSNSEGNWYQLVATNPTESPYVTKEQFEIFKQANVDLMEKMKGGLIDASHDEDVETGVVEGSSSSSDF